MTTVFHRCLYGRFIEIQSNLRRKKVHRANEDSNFFGRGFRRESNLEEKFNPSIIKYDFSSRTDPSISTSIAPVFLDQSNEISWVFLALNSTSQFLSQSTVSSDSIWIQFRSQFNWLPQIRCLITFKVESSITSIDSNITDNIKVINV